MDWDRYAYVRNNPVNNTDPTGHEVCDEEGNCLNQNNYRKVNGQSTTEYWAMIFGIVLNGEEWSDLNKRTVINAIRSVGASFANYMENTSAWGAFKKVYGNTFTFTWSNETPGYAGYCTSSHSITLYSVKGSPRYLQNHSRLIVHELGHAFNNALGKSAQNIPSGLLRPMGENGIIDWGNIRNDFYGYAGSFDDWQFGYTGQSGSEEFADMFIGWAYDTWGTSDLAKERSQFMTNQMQTYFGGW